jgi:hypothetical protein
MRTIAILFTLAVVGGAAPAASFGLGHLPVAVLLFAAALVVFLAACLASGWLLFEHRTLVRAAGGRVVGMPGAVARSAFGRTSPVPLGRPRWVGRAPQALGSRAMPSYPVPGQDSPTLDSPRAGQRIAFARMALSPPPAEPG